MPEAIADFVRDGDVVIAMGAGSIGGVPQKVRDLRTAVAPSQTHSSSGGSR
jgi:UDP-N-acetylmuramate-alanine ligase